MTTTPPMLTVVTDTSKLFNVLKRMHKSDGSFQFDNVDKTIKIAIRNDPEGGLGHFMNFAVLAKVPENDDVLVECLSNVVEAIGFTEPERDEFTFAEFELDRREAGEDELLEMVQYLNQLYNTAICNCGKHLISDGGDMCFFCEFTSTPSKLETIDCPICMDKCYDMHSVTLSCCNAKMHKLCDNTWYKTGNKTCAMCRAELPKRAAVTQRFTLDNLARSIAQEVENRLNANDDDDDDDDDDDETDESEDDVDEE